jgi:acyl carrier protein
MRETMTNIEETIRAYIAKEIQFSDKYGYTDEASFLDEGIVDSMNVLQIVMFIEEKFGLHVEDEEVVPDNFDSVARLAVYVRSKVPLSAVQDQPTAKQAKGGMQLSGAVAGG